MPIDVASPLVYIDIHTMKNMVLIFVGGE